MKKTSNKKVWAVPLDRGPRIPASTNVTMMTAAMALLTDQEIADAIAEGDAMRQRAIERMNAENNGGSSEND